MGSELWEKNFKSVLSYVNVWEEIIVTHALVNFRENIV